MIVDEKGTRRPSSHERLFVWFAFQLGRLFTRGLKAISCIGILVSLGMMALSLFLLFSTFVWQDKLLLLYPDLATPVTLEDLLQKPDSYDGQWVRVSGEIRSHSIVGNSAHLLPLNLEYPGREKEPPAAEAAVEIVNYDTRKYRTVPRFRNIRSGTIIEVVGEFDKPWLGEYLQIEVTYVTKPGGHPWAGKLMRTVVPCAILFAMGAGVFLGLVLLRRILPKHGLFPKKITLEVLPPPASQPTSEETFLTDTAQTLESIGFSQVGWFGVPEMPGGLRLVALVHLEKQVYAAVTANSYDQFIDLVTIYPDCTSVTTTNLSTAMGTGRPDQMHYHILRDADAPDLLAAHLTTRQELVPEMEPRQASAATFQHHYLEMYLVQLAYIKRGSGITQEDLQRIAKEFDWDEYRSP